MQYRRLGRTDMNVSILGFGASSLGGVFRDIDEDRGIETVRVSIENGINFIDVSPYYGQTKAETVLGRALRTIDRARYYLATKVGQYGENEFDFSAGRVQRSVEESRQRLGVEQIDLIQCHDIEFADLNQIVHETLPALHELKARGTVRYVGVTGLPLKVLRRAIERTEPGMIDTILSFCRYTLNDQSLAELFELCEARGIGIINAAPTGMGLLTTRGVPDWHPAPVRVARHCKTVAQQFEARRVSLVGLAVQYACHNPLIATTLIGSADPQRMCENIANVEATYSTDAIAEAMRLLKPVMNHNYTRGRPENQDPIVS